MLKKKLGAEGIERDWSRNRKTVANYIKTCIVGLNSVHFDNTTSAHFNINSIRATIREVIITGTEPLPDCIFSSCLELRKAIFRDSIEEIPHGCFQWCHNLKEVTIPEGVWGIGGRAFYSCWNLKRVVIPESVESIGEGAFEGCEQAEVILRKSVKDIDIGTYAFYDCKKIKYYRKRKKRK